jgi:hypothetical protein
MNQGSERTEPCNHYTTAPLVITRVIWMTSPRRLIPATAIKNTSKNRRCNQTNLVTRWGLTNRGHPSDTGDNQQSNDVVIARFCSFGALVHQRRLLHQSSLPYLSEDRDSSSYQVVSVIRLPVRYTHVPLDSFCFHPMVHKKSTKILYSFRPTTLAQPFAQFSFGVRSSEFVSKFEFGCWFNFILVQFCFFHPLPFTKKINLQKIFHPSTDPPIRI